MRPEKKTLEQTQIPKEETAANETEKWWEEAQFNDIQQDSQR